MAPKPARAAGIITGPGTLTCLVQRQLEGLVQGLKGTSLNAVTKQAAAPLGCVATSFQWCELSQVGEG